MFTFLSKEFYFQLNPTFIRVAKYLLFIWKESKNVYHKLLFLKFLLRTWTNWRIENFNYWNQFVNLNNNRNITKLYVLMFGDSINITFLIRFLIQIEDMFICIWMFKCITIYLYPVFIISFNCSTGTKNNTLFYLKSKITALGLPAQYKLISVGKSWSLSRKMRKLLFHLNYLTEK